MLAQSSATATGNSMDFCSNVVTMYLLALERSVSFDVRICLLLIKGYSREKLGVHWIGSESRMHEDIAVFCENTRSRISTLLYRGDILYLAATLSVLFAMFFETWIKCLGHIEKRQISRSYILSNYHGDNGRQRRKKKEKRFEREHTFS